MDEKNYKNVLRYIYLFLIFGLVALVFVIMRPFLVPLGWAAILVISTWPIYKRLRKLIPTRPSLCAGLMCLIISAIFLLIVVPISIQLSTEANHASKLITKFLVEGQVNIPTQLINIPIIGDKLLSLAEQFNEHRPELIQKVFQYQNQILVVAKYAAISVGKMIFILFVAIFSAYFLFKHGEYLVSRLMRACKQVGGDKLEHLVELVHTTIIATVYGVLMTSLAQGLLAGVGFQMAGIPAPIFWGLATAFLSFIPFGPPFIYVPMAAFLFLTGEPWYWAVFLLIWGTLFVSTADNILRPLFISHATSMSLLLVLLGILGGIAAFGLIGIFVGPVVIAISQKVITEFTSEASAKEHQTS